MCKLDFICDKYLFNKGAKKPDFFSKAKHIRQCNLKSFSLG